MGEHSATIRAEHPKPITRGIKAATARHLEILGAAGDHIALENAFQAAIRELGHGRRLRPISAALEIRGRELCDAHPRGAFVPRFGPGRRLQVCGEIYRVGRGGNSTGVRYAWTDAETWAASLMHERGLGQRAAHYVWSCWSDYPHRALQTIEKFDAGLLADTEMNRLLRTEFSSGPVRCEIGSDNSAHRPCECGSGTLFDWGAGWTGWCWFLTWRCNRCPASFEEYVTYKRLQQIRNPALVQREAAHG